MNRASPYKCPNDTTTLGYDYASSTTGRVSCDYGRYPCCWENSCYFYWQRCDGYKNCRNDGTDELDCPPSAPRPASSVYSSMVFFAFFLVCAVLLAKYCVSASRRRQIRNTRILHSGSTASEPTEPASSSELDDRTRTQERRHGLEYINELNYMPPPIGLSNMGGSAISATANGDIHLPPKYEDIDFSKPEYSADNRNHVQVPPPPSYEQSTTPTGTSSQTTALPVDALTPVEDSNVPPPYDNVAPHAPVSPDIPVASAATMPQQGRVEAASLPVVDTTSAVQRTRPHHLNVHNTSHSSQNDNQVQSPSQSTDRSITHESQGTTEGREQLPNGRERQPPYVRVNRQ